MKLFPVEHDRRNIYHSHIIIIIIFICSDKNKHDVVPPCVVVDFVHYYAFYSTWNELQRSLKSSAMSSFCRLPGLYIRDRKYATLIFRQNRWLADSICQTYAQMKKVSSLFWLRVYCSNSFAHINRVSVECLTSLTVGLYTANHEEQTNAVKS